MLFLATDASGIEPTIIVAVITATAAGLGSWLAFRGQKDQTEAESIVEERKLIASEWGKYRETIEKALDEERKTHSRLEKENAQLIEERNKLRKRLDDV